MKHCDKENDEFPDREFVTVDGVLYHEPPDGPRHRARRRPDGPPPPPAAPPPPGVGNA